MKSALTREGPTTARLLLAAAALALVGAALLPPVISDGPRLVLMDLLAALCHQLPERSFAIAGVQLGLCHRCIALIGGLGAALLLPFGAARWVPPAVILGIAFLPLAVDWGLDVAGLWSNTAPSRVVTGLWAGAFLGLLVGGAAQSSSKSGRGVESSAPR